MSYTSDAPLSPTSTIGETEVVQEKPGPDWLLSAGEEIQSLIAQRHFEETLALIVKCEEHFASDSTFHRATEIAEKVCDRICRWEITKLMDILSIIALQIKQLKSSLSNVLLFELSNCQSRSLHAALISSRRPLKLLAEMGKAREACGTLLRVCTTAIRTSQRQARRNNLEISQLFFCDLTQVASEFLKAFSTQSACISSESLFTPISGVILFQLYILQLHMSFTNYSSGGMVQC